MKAERYHFHSLHGLILLICLSVLSVMLILNVHVAVADTIGWDPDFYYLKGGLFVYDQPELDRDNDGLKDDAERELAEVFRPRLLFDSDENARRHNEPVTLFQVRPEGCLGPGCPYEDCNVGKVGGHGYDPNCYVGHANKIWIRYIFLYAKDGGYGPCAEFCIDDHPGDSQPITFWLKGDKQGFYWKLVYSDIGPSHWAFRDNSVFLWAGPFGRDVFKYHTEDTRTFNIYVSAGKHHHFPSNSWDQMNSPYSKPSPVDPCCDNVDGGGARVSPKLYGNVGERLAHDPKYFTNDLASIGYPGENAWEECKRFCGGFSTKDPVADAAADCVCDPGDKKGLATLWYNENEVKFWYGPEFAERYGPPPPPIELELDRFHTSSTLSRYVNSARNDVAVAATFKQKTSLTDQGYTRAVDHGFIFSTKDAATKWAEKPIPDCSVIDFSPSPETAVIEERSQRSVREKGKADISPQRKPLTPRTKVTTSAEAGSRKHADSKQAIRRKSPPDILMLKLYYSDKYQDYYSTTSKERAQQEIDGPGRYRFIRIQGFVLNEAMVDKSNKRDHTIPLWSFYHPSTHDHLLATTDAEIKDAINRGYAKKYLEGFIGRKESAFWCKTDDDCEAGYYCDRSPREKCGTCTSGVR